MMAGSHGPSGAFTIYRPPWEGFFIPPAMRVVADSSASRIRKEVEDSLRRLQTDRIDLYQVHWPDASVPIAETAETLARLVKVGKIRAIGVSNYSTEQMDLFRQTAPINTVQPPYNLFERQAIRDPVGPEFMAPPMRAPARRSAQRRPAQQTV